MKPPFRYSCETDHEILDDDGLFAASCGDEADARELVRLLNRHVPSEAAIRELEAERNDARRDLKIALRWLRAGEEMGKAAGYDKAELECSPEYFAEQVCKIIASKDAENARLRAALGRCMGVLSDYVAWQEDVPGHRSAQSIKAAAKLLLSDPDGRAALEELERLRQFKTLHIHALECVDRVFQRGGQPEPALLPDFLTLGDDKFRGVVKLAEAYARLRAALDEALRRLKAAGESA